LKDIHIVKLVELLGGILAGNLEQNLLAARVLIHELGDIEHLIVDDNPKVIFLVVLGDFFASERLAHGKQNCSEKKKQTI
jgi:hypothetical protein